MGKLINTMDAGFLFIEKQKSPTHVAALAHFRLPDDAPENFLSDLVARWRANAHFAPPFNYRLKMLPVPQWEELSDDQIDLDYHFRHSALPAPGGERELGVLVSRLHSHGLDRSRPLWECHLIEGLDNNRFALYFKVHHSQIDGVGGIRLFEKCFPTNPQAKNQQPPWTVGMRGGGRRKKAPPLGEQVGTFVNNRVRNIPALTKASARMAGNFLLKGKDASTPFATAKTVLNGRIHGPRRFATQQYTMKRLKAVANELGGTLNDVFLAITAGSLRRYMLELDALPDRSLNALVPVSIRPKGEAEVGNAISFIVAHLHTDIDDPLERIRAIHDSVQQAKRELEPIPASAMPNYTLMLMAPFIGLIALGTSGIGRPMSNITISNVPGPRKPVYLNGAPLEALYPVSLVFDGQALNITVVSYHDTFNIGFTGCRDSLPSMQKMAVYTGEALAELEDALGIEQAA
ncbi:MAG: wax ester/triacylglycerol synthase family O-acyltransferase [Salinisphaeraceae bacterium]|nr:wax ester/triacylglycerol synthase family O-acyltransferase [Salinisphaeraceae bacterium]